MSENFKFDAPQFFDFSKAESVEDTPDNVESYFEIDHESMRESKTKTSLEGGYHDNEVYYSVSATETECREEVVTTECNDEQEQYEIQNCVTQQCVVTKSTDINFTQQFATQEYTFSHYEGQENATRESSTSPQRVTSPEDPYLYSYGLRRSMSVGNLPTGLRGDVGSHTQNLSDKMENLHLSPIRELPHRSRSSRLDNNLNRLAQPKRQFISTEDLRSQKYVSMAELVNKFQHGTPIRFRSKPRVTLNEPKPQSTIPHSPALNAKNRNRPVYALSREEKEKKEIEEARRFKIRANPINKRVMQGPMKPKVNVLKKPITVPEPFKITSCPKKVSATPEKSDPYHFQAKPVPKSLLLPPKPLEQLHQHTEAHTPELMKRYNKITPKKEEKQEVRKQNGSAQKSKLTYTQPAPFSFDKRDQQIIKRREEYIKNVLEEEKKAREFHAKPAPKSMYRSGKTNSSQEGSSGSIRQGSFASSVKSCNSEDDNVNVTNFKAKPPKVLHMKPFIPKKEDHQLTEIVPFDLSSERRAKERKEFEQKLKEKEQVIEALKREQEEQRRLREEEEVARIRKEAEHKAMPIKKYKELTIVPSTKVTEPISPKFHSRNMRNKENIADN